MNEIKRGIKQKQIGMRAMDVQVNGSLATPTVTGIDATSVKSITDLGAGNYTIIFAAPFELPPQAYFGALTADAAIQITAVAYDRITVECTVAGVAADCDFYMLVKGSDYGRLL